MLRFIVRRLLAAIPVLIGLSIILFAFIHLLPGDPARRLLGQHATPERIATMRGTWASTSRSGEQYLRYCGSCSRATSAEHDQQPAGRSRSS